MAKRPTKEAASELSGGAPGTVVVRPITLLDQIIGQAAAKRPSQSSMQSGRIHHAWIFHGPAGVGKFSSAVAFAAALLDPTTSPDLSGNLGPEEGGPVQQMIRAGT